MSIYFTQPELAEFVKAHDNKCDQCGKAGGDLQAHHSTYTAKPDKLLCVLCHRHLHVKLNTPLYVKGGASLNVNGVLPDDDKILRHQAADLGIGYSEYIRTILHYVAVNGGLPAQQKGE